MYDFVCMFYHDCVCIRWYHVFQALWYWSPLYATLGMVMCLIEQYVLCVTTRSGLGYASLCATFECCIIYGFLIYSRYKINNYSGILHNSNFCCYLYDVQFIGFSSQADINGLRCWTRIVVEILCIYILIKVCNLLSVYYAQTI